MEAVRWGRRHKNPSPRSPRGMATATTYALRLTPPPPPPRHRAPLLPQLRRRTAAKVSASWVSAGGGNSDDGVGGWWLPEQPVEQGKAGRSLNDFVAHRVLWWGEIAPVRRYFVVLLWLVGIAFAGFGRALAVGLGASAAIALAGITWRSPSSRKCKFLTIPTPTM
jgi:hypothetical protein